MAKRINSTPRKDGFRMPGEFEEHEQVFMVWPERPDNWRDGGKTKVKISRRGNSLSAWTTPFYTNAATSYDSGSRIVLNLASVNNLTCFSTAAGGGSVGFTTNS